MYCLIVCRSLTYAQRATRILTRLGFHSNVRRLTTELTGNGCSYAVSLPEQELGQALVALAERNMSVKRVYTQFEDGSLQEVFYGLPR